MLHIPFCLCRRGDYSCLHFDCNVTVRLFLDVRCYQNCTLTNVTLSLFSPQLLERCFTNNSTALNGSYPTIGSCTQQNGFCPAYTLPTLFFWHPNLPPCFKLHSKLQRMIIRSKNGMSKSRVKVASILVSKFDLPSHSWNCSCRTPRLIISQQLIDSRAGWIICDRFQKCVG